MMAVSFKQFLRKFNREYDFLYKHRDNVAGFQDAVKEFDFRIHHDIGFSRMVQEFAMYRKDFISSDREAAAYMFAWADMVEA